MTNNLITCRDLTKQYGKKIALDSINLEVGRGKIIGLLGPNGAGKTTLIKILCGLLRQSSGEIAVDGQAIGVHTKSVISYLPDRMYFADWMRGQDLLNLFADFYADFSMDRAYSLTPPKKSSPCPRAPKKSSS